MLHSWPAGAAPWVDMHVHVAGIGAGGSGCFVNPGLAGGWKSRFYFRAFGATMAELEEHGDALRRASRGDFGLRSRVVFDIFQDLRFSLLSVGIVGQSADGAE